MRIFSELQYADNRLDSSKCNAAAAQSGLVKKLCHQKQQHVNISSFR
jgi:hypothetical protein